VAIGLIADPPVLALDEPSASLDPGQRERLWQFIGARARSGTSVVFSTHTLGEAQRFADRVLVLDDGELLFDGPPREFMREAGGDAAGGGDLERALVVFLQRRGR
jgi:ABC-2 type transport system ATP-binding protein